MSTSGIRAEVCIPAADSCPIASLSADGPPTYSVSRSVDVADSGVMTEEFVTDGQASLADLDVDAEPVFEYDAKTAYRFQRERGDDCPCELVERHGSPIAESHTREGHLYITFHVTELQVLRDVLDDLRDAYPDLTVQRLLQSTGERDERDLVYLDRSELTERQREVLRVAHEAGYFDHPKGANASDVAALLGIDRSTFSEHLAAGQRKLLRSILDA
ncbi:MAG: helix-turn-helix domain-containing protein [Halobacteriota archaeon]